MYINKVILIGNLTRDPELKALASGSKVCTFSIATNESYKDSNGVKQEKVEFHNIVVWGKTAENVATYMHKGSQIFIEGKLQTRTWEDKDTKKNMYRTEIIAINIQFGAKASGGSSKPKEQSADEIDPIEYPEEEITQQDIPF